jgi:homogentisate 1,2-dioxygenase
LKSSTSNIAAEPSLSQDQSGYLTGFGNAFCSEALAGALPIGRNSPQQAPMGLYAEVLSGTSFTTPRADNRYAWLYRIRPSVMHAPYRLLPASALCGAPFSDAPASPNALRWSPFALPQTATDFIEGLATLCGAGDPGAHSGLGIHIYRANRSMQERYFFNADGEMLIVPQQGGLVFHTELGRIEAHPNEIVLIPRGLRFRVELLPLADGTCGHRGYVCENFGAPLRLPELGPIGSVGLANARDFLIPQAAFEDREGEFELVQKFQGRLWSAAIDHSPLDVVAWHGTHLPCKYDLARFNTMGTVSFDHPDPSIFTVLTSPSGSPGVANIDFVIFPPRWLVGENTFRPPWYHRNVMSEFMGLVLGQYDTRAEGFLPGGATLHNAFTPHGADGDTYEKHAHAALTPAKLEHTMTFMFETCHVLRTTPFALQAPELQQDYWRVWQGIQRHFARQPER